jgi:glycosyltransferase involved in cell wall biosynthesis
VVLNPRGYQRHVRNDTFLRAIPSISAARPESVFVAVGMEGDRAAQRWVRRLGIEPIVRLLPKVSQEEMAGLFRLADVTVSPSEHDGTPNTLLEGMAYGAFPVAGDIEPIREWIEHGVNGLLCDPSSPDSLAKAVVNALEDTELRRQARVRNQGLVAQRADYGKVMASAEEFYAQVIQQGKGSLRKVESPKVG